MREGSGTELPPPPKEKTTDGQTLPAHRRATSLKKILGRKRGVTEEDKRASARVSSACVWTRLRHDGSKRRQRSTQRNNRHPPASSPPRSSRSILLLSLVFFFITVLLTRIGGGVFLGSFVFLSAFLFSSLSTLSLCGPPCASLRAFLHPPFCFHSTSRLRGCRALTRQRLSLPPRSRLARRLDRTPPCRGALNCSSSSPRHRRGGRWAAAPIAPRARYQRVTIMLLATP